jgi:hypothetical protein
MKRILLALALVFFATAPLAQSLTQTSYNPWANDHNFVAPAP